MKYWDDSDIEYIVYEEGRRVLPYGNPASIVTGDGIRIECEIIPNTASMQTHVDIYSFEMIEDMCVKIERRIWRGTTAIHTETFWVPLDVMGYDEEPANFQAFKYAMEIV